MTGKVVDTKTERHQTDTRLKTGSELPPDGKQPRYYIVKSAVMSTEKFTVFQTLSKAALTIQDDISPLDGVICLQYGYGTMLDGKNLLEYTSTTMEVYIPSGD